jgi:hypothetical protein
LSCRQAPVVVYELFQWAAVARANAPTVTVVDLQEQAADTVKKWIVCCQDAQ